MSDQYTMHDCDVEYWRHCVHCVSGDDDAEITELFTDPDLGLCTLVRIDYPDGDSRILTRRSYGWDHEKGAGK